MGNRTGDLQPGGVLRLAACLLQRRVQPPEVLPPAGQLTIKDTDRASKVVSERPTPDIRSRHAIDDIERAAHVSPGLSSLEWSSSSLIVRMNPDRCQRPTTVGIAQINPSGR